MQARVSDPLGLAQLTLLTVTEVTLVPAVWLMVLGVIPEAPTELWEDRCHHHNLFLSLLKYFKTHFSRHHRRGWVFRAFIKLIKFIKLEVDKRKKVQVSKELPFLRFKILGMKSALQLCYVAIV